MAGSVTDPRTMEEAEFAGYVESGIWMLEEYLLDVVCEENVRGMYLKQLWRDYFS